jgi:membrane protease YdiL (CAAX protease family)
VDPRAEGSVLRPWGLGDALIGLLIAYAGSILVNGLLGADTSSGIGILFLVNIPLWIGLAATPWWAVSRQGDDPVVELGISIRPVDLLALPLGAGVQLLVGLAYAPFVDHKQLEEPSRRLADAAHGAGGTVLLVLMTVVIAPVLEELFYRGLVLRSLQRGLPTWAAVVLCGVIFGAIHFQPLQLLGLAAFGMVAAVLAVRTGRLGPAVLAHLGFNGVALWTLLR